ncbi:MAG TPA: TldD/PmbA family protein [Candidatus Kapabacteria bacterium]|nr:TldD/PmbA family protein [Candidatus Kapabacteria bacterium]
MHRRSFLKQTLASSALALTGLDAGLARATRMFPAGGALTKPSADQQTLADSLISYAKAQGASYCDVRISRYASQSIRARNNVVTGISDSDSFGMGIRVIKSGTWGFSATQNVNERSGKGAVDEALQMAAANSKLQSAPLDLAPVDAVTAEWKTPIVKNPFDISFKDRAEFLLGIHSLAASTNIGGKKLFIDSELSSVREEKYFASSDGSKIWQEITRIDPSTYVTIADPASGEFAGRALFALPQGRGYEYVENYPYKDEIARAVSEASEKLTAASVEPGKYDLILHPTHLWLTIHESIGHPTELDRILGYEANFAGTSFLHKDDLNSLTYGSEHVNVIADRTQDGALATVGFDDDGVPSQSYDLIKEGRLVGLQTTREQAKMIGEDRSRGQSYAQGWWSDPFQRMPNVSLKPSEIKRSMDDLISDTEDGILIKGNSSYSIDHQRYNFQFTGQVAYEIKKGKLGRMLRDVAYQATTTDFWKRCEAICDKSEYMLGGAMNDGKGEPMQSNPVSHGCSPTKFTRINVINTKSQSAKARSGMIDYDE